MSGRYTTPRRKGMRDQRPLLIVIGDGDSERNYFESIKRMTKDVTVLSYDSRVSGTEEILQKVSDCTRSRKKKLQPGDRVAVVTDLDFNYDRKRLREFEDACRAHGYELYVSNPCFEVWLILHYKDYNRFCGKSGELKDEMSRILRREYKESEPLPITRDMVEVALSRAYAKHRGRDCDPQWCLETNPRTTVHHLVDSILRSGKS